MNDWQRVARALLGRWPSQVSTWGEEGIAAFVEELQADGLTAEQALVAIRQHRPEGGKDFPPSVAQISDLARTDPDQPTFEEAYRQLYEPGGVFGFRRRDVTVSPWVLAFVEDYGRERLRLLPVDGEHAGIVRRELGEAWDRFITASKGREVAAIAGRRRGQLGKPDFAGVIGRGN